MDHEIETEAAALTVGGGFLRWRRDHALPAGTPCYNCRTPLKGPWCYNCGQLGVDMHRSTRHLLWEWFESTFEADSRLWRTLPRLLVRPAALTRDYLAGKRAPQVPPLRLFVVALLLVFVSGSFATSSTRDKLLNLGQTDTAKSAADDLAQIQKIKVHVYEPWDDRLTAWARDHLGRAKTHPERLVAAIGAWAHDFAFLALPISALLLSMIFVFRRRFFLFDHLVFSMHSLAFQGLLFTAMIGLNYLGDPWTGWLLLASPVHLFFHMRGVYETGIFGTLVRMFVLFCASTVAVTLIVLALVVVGLAEI